MRLGDQLGNIHLIHVGGNKARKPNKTVTRMGRTNDISKINMEVIWIGCSNWI